MWTRRRKFATECWKRRNTFRWNNSAPPTIAASLRSATMCRRPANKHLRKFGRALRAHNWLKKFSENGDETRRQRRETTAFGGAAKCAGGFSCPGACGERTGGVH